MFHPDSSRVSAKAIGAGCGGGYAGDGAGRNAWVVDLDVEKFFDSVAWDLVIKVVEAHIALDRPWVLLYIKRWLAAPLQQPDGTLTERDRGTRRALYVQLHIKSPMSSAGLCAALALGPGEGGIGGRALRITRRGF